MWELYGAEEPPYSTQTSGRNIVTRELAQSVTEEKQAVEAYANRARTAEASGDQQTAFLYRHIAKEEGSHLVQFGHRLSAIETLALHPDSQEWMSKTIVDAGWREKLDKVFEAAVARARS
jgi:rubrerythrin